MSRYDQFREIIALVRPRTIVEIGTHKGRRAEFMVRRAMRYQSRITYQGFDVFETQDADFHKRALNAKGPAKRKVAERTMRLLEKEFPGRFTWSLVEGDTAETLAGKQIVADLVFIDGDHRVEAIRADYAAVAGARCVVFDDYYMPNGAGEMPDTTIYGCNLLVDELPAAILPVADPCRDGGFVKMAFIEQAADVGTRYEPSTVFDPV